MTELTSAPTGTAAALRREFDRSFAQAPVTTAAPVERMLAVRIRDDAYAIRAAEIAGLHVDRRIVPLPTPMPDLLGIASFRGQLTPVYDLASLLDYSPRSTPRWLVVVRGRDTVGLAFDAFESQLLVSPERLVDSSAAGADTVARRHVGGIVHSGGVLRPIVRLWSVLEDIQQRVEAARRSAGSNER